MSPKKAIYDFFVQSDNLATAKEMSSYLDQFELDMHKRFWTDFNTYMGQKIISSDLGSSWKYSAYNTRRIRKNWEVTKIINPSYIDKQSALEFVFGQSVKDGGFPLYWGVCWNVPPKNFSSAALLTLNSLLIKNYITRPEPPKWIFWGYYRYRIQDYEFLVRCYTDLDGLVQEVINDVWQLFSELHPVLQEINNELS